MQAENLLELGLIDHIISEPLGGAHHHPALMIDTVKHFLLEQWATLRTIPRELLIEQRYTKFRKMGQCEGALYHS